MFGPRDGKDRVHPEGCGWLGSVAGDLPPSEHEVLFDQCAFVETLMQSLWLAEVEVVGRP